MIKRYKYRAYPTKEQDQYFQKIFGCCRFVYNWGLGLKIDSYQQSKQAGENKPKSLSIFDISKKLTELKKQSEFAWLNEVPSIALNWSLQNLDKAYKNFFHKKNKDNGFPKFKNKYKSGKTFSFHQGYKIVDNRITVPKAGWLKFVKHRNYTGDTKTVTVIEEPSGKYYVSIVVDNHKNTKEIVPFIKDKILGIDVGVVNTITLSNDVQFLMDIDFKKDCKKLAREQHTLSKRVRGSSNYRKQRIKVAQVYERIRFKREYQIKMAVFNLVEYLLDNDYAGIAIRKYDIKDMVNKDNVEKEDGKTKKGERIKKRNLNKKLLNGAMGMVCTAIKSKCNENGLSVLEMDADEIKTTGRCRKCDSETVVVNLKNRKLDCKNCGHVEDMDKNAAKNILKYCLDNQKDN